MWCGGVAYPTVVWVGPHKLVWGVSQREKGKIDLYFTPPCQATLRADWSTIIHGVWTLCSPVPSLPHTWAEWVQKPARVNPQGARHAAVASSGRHWQGWWKKSALGKQKGSGQQGHAVWSQIQGRQPGDHIFLCSLHFQVCFNGFRSCPLLTTVVFILCLFHLDLDITSFLAPLLLLGSLG